MLRRAELDKEKRGRGISDAVDRFIGSMTAVLELVDQADQIDVQPGADVIATLMNSLSEDQREAVVHAVQLMGRAFDSPSGGDVEAPSIKDAPLDELVYSPLIRAFVADESSGIETIEFLDPLVGDVFAAVIRTVDRRVSGGDRPHLVRQSLLATAVSALEQLVSALVGHALAAHPAMLSESEYSFRLKDLERFESIQDARDDLLQRRVSSVLSEGLEGWGKFFSRRDVNVDIEELTGDWQIVREFLARRNLMIHKGGVVDEKYLYVAGDYYKKRGPAVGAVLKISSGYMRQGVQLLASLGCTLGYGVWSKLHADELLIAQRWTVDLQRELIDLGLWVAAVDLHDAIPERSFLSRELLTQSCIYKWTGMKFGPYPEENYRREIEGWDTTALDPVYSHSKFLLLDQAESAKDSLMDLHRSGKLMPSVLHINPLYRDYVGAVVEDTGYSQ